jgi:prepilin-type N-terminal cleavage/methylation domain-containing protein
MTRNRTWRQDHGVDRVDAPAVRRDRGTSLVELLVTIVIMGIIIAPVMNAVIGVIKASATNRGLSQVETVLNNGADQVNRAPRGCDYTQYVQTAALNLGWPRSSATVDQYHYVPGASPTVSGTWASGACIGSTPDDLLVQLVNITVRNPETGAQRTIQVVKSDV